MWDVLASVGFETRDETDLGDRPSLYWENRQIELKAYWCINRHFQRVIYLGGTVRTGRELGMIEHHLPRKVESREQGLGLLAWAVDRNLHYQLSPDCVPHWLLLGHQYQHLLPWERELAEYQARPCCFVERDWAKLALRQLAEALTKSDLLSTVSLTFDGEILRIQCGEDKIAVAAEGKPWTSAFQIAATNISSLPKRLMYDRVEFSVYHGSLNIGRRRYDGATTVADGEAK